MRLRRRSSTGRSRKASRTHWWRSCRRPSRSPAPSASLPSTACAWSMLTASGSPAPPTPRRPSSCASKPTTPPPWNASSATSVPHSSRSSPMRLFRTSFLIGLFFVAGNAMAACPALLDRTMDTIHEKPQSLCEYAGKVVLVVNTASQCGYTPQYDGLEALYRRYKDRGLVVLGFPANDFGGQEPGSNKEISAFCVNQYAIDFPMFAKIDLKKSPLYTELTRATGTAPRWNFHKYLIDRSGNSVQSFDTRRAERS